MRGDALRKIAVFGGTGFLGRRIVRHFLDRGDSVRVVARHPQRGEPMFRDHTPPPEFVSADVNDEASLGAAMSETFGVVNAVSLYVEHGDQTFHSVHVEAAARVATRARDAGVTRLAHVSGIGADPRSHSPYIRSRGEGENAVRASFPNAIIVRPAVMFGPDDAFLTPLITLLRKLPVFPLFGHGHTALQPAYVDDVAQAVVRAFEAAPHELIYELGGPRIYAYKDLLQTLAADRASGASSCRYRLRSGRYLRLAPKCCRGLPSPAIRSSSWQSITSHRPNVGDSAILQSSRAGWRRCSRSPRYEANLIARLMSLIRRPNSNRSMIFGAMNQLVGRDRG